MSMKPLNVPYLCANHPDPENRSRIVVQTQHPHLVGLAHLFSPQPTGEERRLQFLSRITNPVTVGKATGYRVYVTLYATLDVVDPAELGGQGELIQQTLAEMADFYVSILPDGMRRNSSEDNLALNQLTQ